MYWGLDGCKAGWLAIGLSYADEQRYAIFEDIEAFWQAEGAAAHRVLIDIPIGLASGPGGRRVDFAARAVLGPRRSSVFPVPTRQALNLAADQHFAASSYGEASRINQVVSGKKISKQAWNILPKIHEVDALLRKDTDARAVIQETHPEVLFRALGGAPMRYSKKNSLGFYDRLMLLSQHLDDVSAFVHTIYGAYQQHLAEDDVLDALVCAIAARHDKLHRLPAEPESDAEGLPMQILYPETNVR